MWNVEALASTASPTAWLFAARCLVRQYDLPFVPFS
jgi:hypothetical protein